MSTLKLTKLLTYILVIGIGGFVSWNLTFFKPFNAAYPSGVELEQNPGKGTPPLRVRSAIGNQYQLNWFGEFWLGKHYRFLWTTPVNAPVLDLTKEGLKLTKRGGGMQTTSFTLKDEAGNSYSLRSLDKDPVSVIPPALWRTVLGDFIRDQVSATDPFALPAVLSLTESAGIASGWAKLFFVQQDNPSFKNYQLPGNGFYFLSPKYNQPLKAGLDGNEKLIIYSTEAMLQALERNSAHQIDTAIYLRCRLFDLFISDWDRHAGQWDWAGFKAGKDTVFYPLPKDRDQAFGIYNDGVFPFLLTRNFAARKISSLTPMFEDIEGFSQNGSELDQRFLKTVPFSAYQRQVLELQKRLTARKLNLALEKYPEPVKAQVIKKLLPTLLSRRNSLLAAAKEYESVIKNHRAD